MPSPPKPWERAGVSASIPGNTTSTALSPPVGPAASVTSSSPTVVENNATTTTAGTPAVPARPASLTQPIASTSTLNSTALAPNSSLYSSPYNRFGSTYSPFGTGYGGYGGGGYGSYGSSMYSSPYGSPYGSYGGMGYGGMGMGMGMPGYGTAMPGLDPSQSLTAQLSNTTAQTFTLLHSIVQTFGGFAQMLDSTFMATHSSFFAMVGVIDQFAALRDVLGQVLGVFGLVRWVKGVLSGEGVVPRGAMAKEFEAFVNHQQHGGAGVPIPGAPVPGAPKPSKKPIIVFLLAIFGIPYLMHKLIRRLAERPPILPTDASGQPMASMGLVNPGSAAGSLDPAKLTFAHTLYEFATDSTQELALKKGDIVAVLMMNDPVTGSLETEWWRGRTRDGREGWFPRRFVEVIQRKTGEEERSSQKVEGDQLAKAV
ncbi:Peroxisomal membrane protein PAS20 [Serendipita sp. 407]|nr:Peroxisomal membrane protein PAS20 [Serendipita sp. 407]